LGDATLVSVLAYAGLRPGEALALQWRDVQERTLVIERALALGDVKLTKTGQARAVRLLAPLGADLAEWRLACGRPGDSELVFPTRDGRPWTDSHWRNWRKRVFKPAAMKAELERFRPYDLRHAFVSLLLAERRSVLEVAKQAGHSPTMTLTTYGHVIEELEGTEKQIPEEVIRRARDELVRTTFARDQGRRAALREKSLQTVGSPLTDSNRRPPPYHGGALPTELRGQRPKSSRPCHATSASVFGSEATLRGSWRDSGSASADPESGCALKDAGGRIRTFVG
jgi:Phage integrase family